MMQDSSMRDMLRQQNCLATPIELASCACALMVCNKQSQQSQEVRLMTLRYMPFFGDKVKPIATCRGTCIYKFIIIRGSKLWVTYNTSVFDSLMNVYLLRVAIRAILASSRANLIPMQLRGPKPNGMWASCGRLALSSGENLWKIVYPHIIQEGIFGFLPARLKSVWSLPVEMVFVDYKGWNDYARSLWDCKPLHDCCLQAEPAESAWCKT